MSTCLLINVASHNNRRYDLKEEYADCLLLCRHCRCLFWKSIGHPCIRGEELPEEEQEVAAAAEYLSSRLDGVARQLDGLMDVQNQDALNLQQHRPSVALLSRNFDGGNRRRTLENPPPPGLALNEQRRQGGRASSGAAAARRPPLVNLNQVAAAAQGGVPERNLQRAAVVGRQANATHGDQIVPKHVTITPQAFLKFFSL